MLGPPGGSWRSRARVGADARGCQVCEEKRDASGTDERVDALDVGGLDGAGDVLERLALELQRAALAEALALTGGNAAEAARLLGTVGRGTAEGPGGTVRAMLRRLAK